MTPVDEARATPRPSAVGTFYLEQEFDDRGIEQIHIHAAEGEAAASGASATATSLEAVRAESLHLVKNNRPVVDAALRHCLKVEEVLSPFVVRKGSNARYVLTSCALVAGDIAGQGGAAIAYGELPILALCQAASAGVATITAGLVGAQFKHYQLAKQRHLDVDTVSEELKPYLPMLAGAGAGRGFVVAVTAVGVGIALAISGGIFALRSSIEGTASGVTFGLLALGIAAASWVNSYTHADPVADVIDGARHNYTKKQRAHRRLAVSPWMVWAGRAIERARVIRREYQERGQAANAHIQALKYEALSHSPDVVGHGYELVPPSQRAIKGKRL